MNYKISRSITNKYYYANGQILRQDNSAGTFYYIHDRLGSIRLVTDSLGDVRNTYTYNPFGEMFATECAENTENPFKFTGQWYDSEIGQYDLRARMYQHIYFADSKYSADLIVYITKHKSEAKWIK